MGNFIERLPFYSSTNSYVDVWKFGTDDQIDFEFKQMRQWETVKSAGQQQALAQIANVGGLGGGAGGGYSALTPWGNTPAIWLGVSNFFVVSAVVAVPLLLVLSVVVFLAELGRVAAFFSVFGASLFASIWLLYHTPLGIRLATFPALTLYGVIFGCVAGGVAAVLYSESARPAQQAAAGGGYLYLDPRLLDPRLSATPIGV